MQAALERLGNAWIWFVVFAFIIAVMSIRKKPMTKTNAAIAATFAAWLDIELNQRHWSNREIARRMGVSHAAINNVRRGENRPTSDLCIKIAQALDVPVEVVYRNAGVLPPAQEGTDEEQRLVHLFRNLDKRDKDTILRIAAVMAEHTEAEPDSPLPLTETQP